MSKMFYSEPTCPKSLYSQATTTEDGTWLIVPTQEGERYRFVAFDPDGQDWSDSCFRRYTYATVASALEVGKRYVVLVMAQISADE
ncbi:MAG: hypothetical protein WCA35_10200 [Kovacikia sp.]